MRWCSSRSLGRACAVSGAQTKLAANSYRCMVGPVATVPFLVTTNPSTHMYPRSPSAEGAYRFSFADGVSIKHFLVSLHTTKTVAFVEERISLYRDPVCERASLRHQHHPSSTEWFSLWGLLTRPGQPPPAGHVSSNLIGGKKKLPRFPPRRCSPSRTSGLFV